jgi:hypothetical protein
VFSLLICVTSSADSPHRVGTSFLDAQLEKYAQDSTHKIVLNGNADITDKSIPIISSASLAKVPNVSNLLTHRHACTCPHNHPTGLDLLPRPCPA